MTVGITSSLRTASLNWICVPAELTVAYGISSPSEIEAVPFSTVTTSGRASVRVLLSSRSASSARLMLYRLLVKPNAIPPAHARHRAAAERGADWQVDEISAERQTGRRR